jgi:ABC-type nitrate/sulfonate/bicarbonate transport system substrate-binding protein
LLATRVTPDTNKIDYQKEDSSVILLRVMDSAPTPNVIFVTEDTIQNRPELVESFLRATLRGYEESIADTEMAARTSVEFNSEPNYEDELASMRVSISLIALPDTAIGMMNPNIWQLSYELLQDGDVLPADFNVTISYNFSFLY